MIKKLLRKNYLVFYKAIDKDDKETLSSEVITYDGFGRPDVISIAVAIAKSKEEAMSVHVLALSRIGKAKKK